MSAPDDSNSEPTAKFGIAVVRTSTTSIPKMATELAGFLQHEVNIKLADLPPYVADKLAAFDADGDGCISTTEIMRHGAALEHARHKNKTYRNMFIILFIAWLVQMGAVFGVVAGVVTFTRQTVVPPGAAALTTKDGSAVIQTAAFSQQSDISSVLPDASFAELTHFTVSSPSGSWVKLVVLGTARIRGEGMYGSVVQLLTVAGTVTIDGRSMLFATDVAPVFERAGFIVAPSRRRLLDTGVALAGFFNYLASFNLDALEAAAGAAPNTTFAGFPSSYIMQATAYTKCDIRSDTTGAWCFSAAAAPLLAVNPDFPDTPLFSEHVSLMVLGSQLRAVSTYSYTSRKHVAVTDSASNALVQGDLADGSWGNCVAVPGGVHVPSSIFDPVIQANITPVFVDASSSVLGTAARHFTFTLPALDPALPPAMVLHYYDALATHKPLRVLIQKPLVPQAADVLFDFSRFDAITADSVAAGTFLWDGPAYVNGAFPACGPAAIVDSGRAAFELADAAAAAVAPAPAPAAAGRHLLATGAAGRRLLAVCNDTYVAGTQCVYSMIRSGSTCTETAAQYAATCCPTTKAYPRFFNQAISNTTACTTAPYTGCTIACCPTTSADMLSGCVICSTSNICSFTPSSPPPPRSPPPSPPATGRRLAQSLAQALRSALRPPPIDTLLIKSGSSSLRFASGAVYASSSTMTISFGYDTWPSNAQAYCEATVGVEACRSTTGLSVSVTPTYHNASDPIVNAPKALRDLLTPLGPYSWLGYDTKPVGSDFTCSLLSSTTALSGSGTTGGTTTTLQACYRAYEMAVFQAPIVAARTIVSLRTCVTATVPQSTSSSVCTTVPKPFGKSAKSCYTTTVVTNVVTTTCDDFTEIVSEDLLSANGVEFSARRGVLTPNACVKEKLLPDSNYRASFLGSPSSVFSCAEQFGGLSTANGSAANFGSTIALNSLDGCYGCAGLATCPLRRMDAVSVPQPTAIFTCPSLSVKRYSFAGWSYTGCINAPVPQSKAASFWGRKLGTSTLNDETVGPQYTVAQCQAVADQLDLSYNTDVYWVGVSAAGDCYVTGDSRQFKGGVLNGTTCTSSGTYVGYPPQMVGGADGTFAVYGLA